MVTEGQGGRSLKGRCRFASFIGRRNRLKKPHQQAKKGESESGQAVQTTVLKTTEKPVAGSKMIKQRQHRAKAPSKKRAGAELGREDEGDDEPDHEPPKKSRPAPKPLTVDSSEESGSETEDELEIDDEIPSTSAQDPILYGGQKALACIERICTVLDIKWQGCTLKPEDAIWSKIGGTFVRKTHPEYRLTFSSFESFHIQIGRFVAAMIYAKSDLAPKFTPGGVHIWRHGWFDSEMPRCLHGVEMVYKPRTVELNPSSEAGKRAIAEQNGSVEKNRYGRPVVVLRFDKNVVCYKDAKHSGFPHPHAAGSCAMCYSDASKAMSAMTHDIQWTRALYPNADAKRAEECILICTSCCCNYSNDAAVAGRQTCRMTAYRLSGVEDISSEMVKTRRDMRVHKEYPHTMVYSCCNPQTSASGSFRSTSKKSEKSCGWRLSAMDLRYAYVFANELFTKVFGKPFRTNISEFKWSDAFAFKTDVINPIDPVQTADPFA